MKRLTPDPTWSAARAAAIADHSLLEARDALEQLIERDSFRLSMAEAGDMICESLGAGGRIFSCGNGGSLCDAMHFAEELSGRFRADRPALAAVAIADPAHISCTANDYGYEAVFSRYLEGHGRAGDVLLAISTSGTSANVLRAAETAAQQGLQIIALTGQIESPLAKLAHLELCTPGGKHSDRVQELHIKVIHILIELIEAQLFKHHHQEEETP